METITPVVQPVNEERLQSFTRTLLKYRAGKAVTDSRIRESEKWWKLRNTSEEQKVSRIGADGGFSAKSGWLHNTIVAKHADAMDSYPEANILPREPNDRQESSMLSSIIPCVMEQNHFESTYSDVMWQKLKSGTGLYKVFWNKNKHNGLGDVGVEKANVLSVFWEPGITDIQRSKYVFSTELWDKATLAARYPELKDKIPDNSYLSSRYEYDDPTSDADKCTVVECYYKVNVGGKDILHYVRYVGTEVIYATENDPQYAQRGLYDHGLYPYVFDSLYPIEGSPCGYGYVDICRNPQTIIDLIETAAVKNAMVGATPRYFMRGDAPVNEEEFLDVNKPIVHVTSGVSEEYLRRIETNNLDGAYLNLLDRTTQELRETSGNTESASGVAPSGVTAASAIAALQEAAGKGSRDSTLTSYRAYTQVIELVIELIRQFYDMPRKFRITGKYGEEQFVSYTNAGIKPQAQGNAFGVDLGFRTPLFDVRVSAAKKTVYTRVSQNELALQFFQLGFFNPAVAPQALMCLDMMDFDSRDEIRQMVARNGSMAQKLMQYMQLAEQLASVAEPRMLPMIQQDMAMFAGTPAPTSQPVELSEADGEKENAVVEKARKKSNDAVQPTANREVTA